MDNQKNTRRTTGIVVSDSMDKSATVAVQRRLKHPLYNKYVYKTTKIMIPVSYTHLTLPTILLV